MKTNFFSDKIKISGRAIIDENGIVLEDSASGISFYTDGEVYMSLAPMSKELAEGCPYIGVVKDNNFSDMIKLRIEDEISSYKIVENGDGREHKYQIIKLTENQYGGVRIYDFKISDGASLRPTDSYNKKILFIGDSITAGYGVDGIDGVSEFSTSEENVLKSYAYLVSESLKAEAFVFASSGNGIISRWTENPDVPVTDGLMPEIFPFKEKEASFENPDVTVINLGTNDSSYTGENEEKKRKFETEYKKFLAGLRIKYPYTEILVLYGFMENTLLKSVEAAVNAYIKATGDNKVYYMELEGIKKGEILGASGHPGAKMHEERAEKIGKKIKEITGWK